MRHRSGFRYGWLAILFFIALLALGGWIVMALWNWILPGLTGVGMISFEKAIGLLLLCRLLFGRWRGRKPGPPWMRNKERTGWMNWSPEEKERLQSEWKRRCNKEA